MSLFDLLTRPIAFHPALARLLGDIPAAVLLGQAIYWTRTLPDNRGGWFYKKSTDWEVETTLSKRQQERARGVLRNAAGGFWKEELRGLPARLWYKVDELALEQALARTFPVAPFGATGCTDPCNKTDEEVQQGAPNRAANSRDYIAETTNKKAAAAPRSRGTTAAEAAAAFSILIKNDQDLLRLESLIEKLGEGWEKYLSAAVAEVRAREVKNVPFVSNVESPALRRLNDDQRQVRLEKSAAAVCRQESDFSVSGTQRPKLPRAPGGGIRQQHFKSER